MERKEIVARLKAFCEYELKMYRRWNSDLQGAITRCYGAVMFVINLESYDEELANWWDDEMLPKFKELEERV